jgi:hypothetical protein
MNRVAKCSTLFLRSSLVIFIWDRYTIEIKKRKSSPTKVRPFSHHNTYTHPKEGIRITFMIRLFAIFSKLNFSRHTDLELYLQALSNFSTKSLPCSYCGAKNPSWKQHAVYKRYLISFENGHCVINIITIDRLICSSCDHTHAILPEILIPHSSYGILYIIQVLRDYFRGIFTVVNLCEHYQISVSTLYAWKKLFLLHKKLWLGVLEDSILSISAFLNRIPSVGLSNELLLFFQSQRISFLQGISKTTHSGYT